MSQTPTTPPERRFEDLSLAEMVGQLRRSPRATLRALRSVTARRAAPPVWVSFATPQVKTVVNWPVIARAVLWVAAVLTGLIGCLSVASPVQLPYDRQGLLNFAPLINGALWWLAAMVLAASAEVVAWVNGISQSHLVKQNPSHAMPFRWLWFALSIPLMVLAYLGQERNQFTLVGVVGWVLSVVMLVAAFWPRNLDPLAVARSWADKIITLPRRQPWLVAGLVAVMLVAGYMRLVGFDSVPAEMTSDHIEKLIDSQRVLEGSRDIFFASNGGREPFQMYFLAFLGSLTGGLTFNTLKVAAAIESLLGIVVFYGLGRAVVGDNSRRAHIFGLIFALLAAVGYWHIVVTRVSLRIMLTPLVTGLVLWALVRLLRWNRRSDALWAGVLMGLGIYGYQALRLLPILAFVAVLIGLIFVAQTWRQRGAYLVNLGVMALVSFALFVPLLRYSADYPDDFWRRAAGRLLGDSVICEYDDAGGCAPRSATISERVEALVGNLPALGSNFVRALGMFTYRGDVAWLHNAPNYPAFDPISGALLVSGLGCVVVWSIRRRDAVPFFMLLALLVMLIPSASAIANPTENPSFTRASGAMPPAYFLAAAGLVGLSVAVGAAFPARVRTALGVGLVAGVVLLSGMQAHRILFGPYNDYYQVSWSPERDAGAFVRGFVDSGGAWGNVYILSYEHFYDYRGVAIAAGLTPGKFPNGDIATERLPMVMGINLNRRWDDPWVLYPDRDLMIIYSFNDTETLAVLKSWFPNGYEQYVDTRMDTPWLTPEPFWAFRVPALGRPGIEAFLAAELQ